MMLTTENVFHNHDPNFHLFESEMTRILQSSFKCLGVDNSLANVSSNLNTALWQADFHGFENCQIWRGLRSEQRVSVLDDLQNDILKEIYFIEISGMAYAAKMNLLSDTLEERQFYCVMGAEEAAHFHALSPYFQILDKGQARPSSFTELIGKIAAEGDRLSCLSLLQVLLEGWGLYYYQSLSDLCHSAHLKSVFSKILNDETRHHAAGVLLFRKYSNGRFSSFMADSLASLLQKVQAGPVMAAQALLREANRLELKSAKALLTEMRAQESTQHKLQRIRNIIGKIMVSDDLEHFDKMKMFSPFDENTMAQIIVN